MKRIFIIFLLILLHVNISLAAPIDLYTGEAVVETKQPSERKAALPRALQQVLTKLTGLSDFDDYPQVRPALGSAASIVVSFHYRSVETSLEDGSESSELRLVASFPESEVDQLLKRLQLPLWPQERPTTEVWVIVDDGTGRKIMPEEYEYVREPMNEVATTRGLPLAWPVPDEEGMYLVDVQLLWGGYTDELTGGNGAVLIAAARREGANWSVRLNLDYGGQNWAWRHSDVDLQRVLGDSMQEAVDLVVAANTIVASDQGQWLQELTVSGVGGARDYRECLDYLQKLSVVERVSVKSASRGLVEFSLELNAAPMYLKEALASGRMLEYAEADSRWVLRK